MGKWREKILDVLLASEMYCSLKFESAAGCPYGAFTQRGIARLAALCSASALVALIAGM